MLFCLLVEPPFSVALSQVFVASHTSSVVCARFPCQACFFEFFAVLCTTFAVLVFPLSCPPSCSFLRGKLVCAIHICGGQDAVRICWMAGGGGKLVYLYLWENIDTGFYT